MCAALSGDLLHPTRHRVTAALAVAGLALHAAAAGAEDAPAEGEPAASNRSLRPNAAYVELLGKNGLYGLGYDRALSDRLAVGGAAAWFTVESEEVLSLSPYVNVYPLAGSRWALALQAGAQLVHVKVPSRVVGWSGASATGVAGQVSAGFEFRSPVLCRFLASGVFGRGGFRPWAGLALGSAF
jgi:hypothetical protein